MNQLFKRFTCTIIIIFSLVFLYFQSNLGNKSLIFRVFTWDRSISRFFKPRLVLMSEGVGGTYPNDIDSYLKNYYFYNFSNSRSDFVLVNDMIKENIKKNKVKDDTIEYVYGFLWNTIFDSAHQLLIEPETQQGADNLGLFSISVLYYAEGYYFTNIYESCKLNNFFTSYCFKKQSEIVIETDADFFDFIFWTQAEDFMDKQLPNRIGTKVIFQNEEGQKIVEFDYRSKKGYKLIF
jgi:hypothetical protein